MHELALFAMRQLISNKREYLRLAKSGLAGNCPQTWDTAEEFMATGAETVGLRITDPGSPNFRPYVCRHELLDTIDELGLSPGDYYLTENVPPNEVLLAGELSWNAGDWVFFHSLQRAQTRAALAESGLHLRGSLQVWLLIEAHCCADEWDDLLGLIDRYSPGGRYPVVELTFTTVPHGIFQRNPLIWEIRHY